MDGTGVARNPQQAVRLLHKACEGNDKAGCTSLGFALRDAAAGFTNLPKAVALFTKACELDDPPACDALGYAFSHGQGADKDLSRALALYTKACDLGQGSGCFNAGQMHGEASGVPEDLKLAASFYRRGCDLDDATACTQLGFMFVKGQGGLAKNEGTAGVLFERACNAGEQIACDNLRVLARQDAAPGEQAERRRVEIALPSLFAKCMENRAAVERLRVGGMQAARAGNRGQADDAGLKLKALEPEWAETLEKVNRAIELVTTDAAGERDQDRYITLMRRFNTCSCEPTRSGRCR
jgi:TPR repeat protein